MTDHHRSHDDWDQDALFYGVPSRADRPPGRPGEPGGPTVPATSDDQPTRVSAEYLDPTTMPMTGRAQPTVSFDPTTMAMPGAASAPPDRGRSANVSTGETAPGPGRNGPPRVGAEPGQFGPPPSGPGADRHGPPPLRSGAGQYEPPTAGPGAGRYGPPPPEVDAGRYRPPPGVASVPDLLEPVPGRKGYGRLPLIVAALAVLLIAGAVGGVVLMRSSGRDGAVGPVPDPTQTTSAETAATTGTATTGPTPSESPAESPSGDPSTEATATVDPQEEALAQLEAIRQQDLATVSFDGQFVAQIASKYPGVNDPYQVAADGSHTFGISDILAEHQRLRTEHGDAEHPVILLKSTDYGKRQTVGGEPLWVTFVVGDFPDKESVLSWCAGHFGNLSAAELKNHCDSRNLRPAA